MGKLWGQRGFKAELTARCRGCLSVLLPEPGCCHRRERPSRGRVCGQNTSLRVGSRCRTGTVGWGVCGCL